MDVTKVDVAPPVHAVEATISLDEALMVTRIGRYYHASGERRAVIWRAVSNEKPIIVKNISYFRKYF